MLTATAILLCAVAALLPPASADKWLTFAPNYVGTMKLPSVDPAALPTRCRDFNELCSLETEGMFELAFAGFEERYTECGDFGWSVDGSAHGSEYSVTFKTTPCGTRTAVKGLRTPKECTALKLLTTGQSAAECPGCFPQHYYYSNTTKACYSEFLDSQVPMHKVVGRSLGVTAQEVAHIKRVFLQGVRAILVLRSHNIEHHDLSFRNMLLREEAGGPHLVIFDLAGSVPLDQRLDRRRSLGANGVHTDMHMLCTAFLGKMYSRREIGDVDAAADQSTFLHALLHVRRANSLHSHTPEYANIARVVDAVTSR